MRHSRNRPEAGFTLVEILVVVVLLGVLAALVIPQFSNATSDASASTLKSQLGTVRSQIELYRARYGVSPALGTSGDASDWDVLTQPGSELCYLQVAPKNPFTGHVGIGDAESVNVGWVWDAANGLIWAPYFDEITNTYDPP